MFEISEIDIELFVATPDYTTTVATKGNISYVELRGMSASPQHAL